MGEGQGGKTRNAFEDLLENLREEFVLCSACVFSWERVRQGLSVQATDSTAARPEGPCIEVPKKILWMSEFPSSHEGICEQERVGGRR